jgi:hypothetical protein
MELQDICVELNIKMLELERAIDAGMPYSQLKKIYVEIKELQYQCIMAELQKSRSRQENADMVIE